MKQTVIALIIVLVALMSIALWHGTETFTNGWRSSLEQLTRFVPLLLVAILISGYTEVLLPKNAVENWLSDSSGWRGISVAWLAGMLTPGGSIIGLPIIATLYQAGVGISVLMTYATSLATLSIIRVPLEIGFYGWRLTGMRILVSLALPLIAGLLTHLIISSQRP